jgi:type I restriction enzyme, R subunit
VPHDFNENQLVEQPAIKLFAELGWQFVSAKDEVFGVNGTLGRETKSEAILVPRLRSALEGLNPQLPPEAIALALNELTHDRSSKALVTANREVYDLLKDGVTVSVPDREQGGQKTVRVRVIDWQNPAANNFLLANQFSITGTLYTGRPDLVGFVNGLPMIVIELKKPGVPAQAAFDDNLTWYKDVIPQVFWSNALLISSNGIDSRVGSLTSNWERFFEWKRIESENEPRRVSLEVLIRGVCEPRRFLDLVENFTIFSQLGSSQIKILGQNHQFLGVNNAIASMLKARELRNGRGGVFWQTQGSGKSLAMVFFAQKVFRTIPGNWTFVIVTDRSELDDQIAKTFKICGAVSETESDQSHAESTMHLRDLLSENHRYVFTLIHKFRTDPGETHPVLSERRDIIVINDEAHRTQYDTLALNMRMALPNATFLAFTGTPLIATEERTREVFGDYVSIYDFQQSVEDGATVALFYENRTPELHLKNANLNEDLYALIEQAELSEEAERKLQKELGRQYHLITRDDRLEVVAKDIVYHFLGRGFQGKGMVVSIDKATALRMYDKVRKYWEIELKSVERQVSELSGSSSQADRVKELHDRLQLLTSTDMGVVVSPGQNEIEQMKAVGLNILPHRKRMNDEKLDEKFKDPNDPFRLVFVCAMWLTGFDAPSCSTIYLDKPMRNHTLMQTIARANRVFPGKHSGLIVDYANVFASLERALAIYGKGKEGATPVRDKNQLLEMLRQVLEEAYVFCEQKGVDLRKIESAPLGSFERVERIGKAVNALISPDSLRKDFLAHEKIVRTLFQAVKPDPAVVALLSAVSCLITIADAIRLRIGAGHSGDISDILTDVNRLLDGAIAADGFRIDEGTEGQKRGVIDLAKIDFEVLGKKFAKSKTKNVELEQLKASIRAQLDKLVRLNRTRIDFVAKLEELIESYNQGSRNIEELFQELLALSKTLTKEQQRHVRENLTEEELTVFDILTRPGPDLSPEERAEIKKVSHNLLDRLKGILTLDWRKRVTTRARVQAAIEGILDEGLPRAYTPELYQGKCKALFEHVYENYVGSGVSVYTVAA